MHTRMYALLRWRTYRKSLSEFLEHLASYNGADMRKYNTLYTRKLSVHVLPPESLLEIFLYLCILQALLAVLPPISSLKVFLSNFYLRIYASSCRNLSRIIEEISSTSSFPSPWSLSYGMNPPAMEACPPPPPMSRRARLAITPASYRAS